MVMDQFVTTYRRDYLWPYVRALGLKPEPERFFKSPNVSDHGPCSQCACIEKQPIRNTDKVLGPNALKQQEWSRLAPMGLLLDPKLYPAKVGPPPETETMRFNQPNVFMKKLQEKYPFIYEILRTAPPDDQIARINKDRLLSTYQVDFCKMQEYPSAPYDELLRSAGVQGLPPCPEPHKLPGDPYRPNVKSEPFRPTIASKAGGLRTTSGGGIRSSGGAGGCAGLCDGSLPAGATEYKDVISKLGEAIVRDNVHVKPRVVTRHCYPYL